MKDPDSKSGLDVESVMVNLRSLLVGSTISSVVFRSEKSELMLEFEDGSRVFFNSISLGDISVT